MAKVINTAINSVAVHGLGTLSYALVGRLAGLQRMAQEVRHAVVTPWQFETETLQIERHGIGRGTGRRWDYALFCSTCQVALRQGKADGVVIQVIPHTSLLYQQGVIPTLSQVKILMGQILGEEVRLELGTSTLCTDIIDWPFLPRWGFNGETKGDCFVVNRVEAFPKLIEHQWMPARLGAWEPLPFKNWTSTGRDRYIESEFKWVPAIPFAVFDKLDHFRKRVKPLERGWLETVWQAGGWQKERQIFRIEFTLAEERLKQLGLQHPHDLFKHRQELWQFLTADYLHHVNPQSGSPDMNWPLTPMWQDVQAQRLRA